MSFSELLKQCRKKQGVSQAELASRLGVTQQAVGKWESGKSSPDPSTVARHCRTVEHHGGLSAGACTARSAMFLPPNERFFGQLHRKPDPGHRHGEGRLRRTGL